jgi:hypothetical protein
MAGGLTRSDRKLSITPLRCRDRRLVHRPSGADSLEGEAREECSHPFIEVLHHQMRIPGSAAHPCLLACGDCPLPKQAGRDGRRSQGFSEEAAYEKTIAS